MLNNKTIFISALDWGLGHATRCVPLIKQLMVNNTVIIGVTKTTALVFNEEFPELTKVDIEPYKITYSKVLPLFVKLALDAPRILSVIKIENKQLTQFIKQYHIDVVISDNRFGLYHKNVQCIYITHQFNLKAGWFSFIANKIHHHFIKKFDAVWLPDFEDERNCLAGELSRNHSSKSVKYLGTLSRLPLVENTTEIFDYLCLLSGPEPLRTELENSLLKQAALSHKKIGLVRGTNSALNQVVAKNVTVFNMPTASELSRLISTSKTIICRSGYSTLMDLHHLKKQNLILIPTPGQSEQKYLANYWQEKFSAKVIQQKALSSVSVFD